MYIVNELPSPPSLAALILTFFGLLVPFLIFVTAALLACRIILSRRVGMLQGASHPEAARVCRKSGTDRVVGLRFVLFI